MNTQPAVCWSEIPVRDLDIAITFYNTVFDWNMKPDTSGPTPTAFFGGSMETAGGNLYVGEPGTDGKGSTVHMIVPDTVEKASERCISAGGKINGDIIDIPPGRFVYAVDPDGNSVGLFEPRG